MSRSATCCLLFMLAGFTAAAAPATPDATIPGIVTPPIDPCAAGAPTTRAERLGVLDETKAAAGKAEHDAGVPAAMVAAMSLADRRYATPRLTAATHRFLWPAKPCESAGEGNEWRSCAKRADGRKYDGALLFGDATSAYRSAVSKGANPKAAAIAWLRGVSACYVGERWQNYADDVLRAADDAADLGTRETDRDLWDLLPRHEQRPDAPLVDPTAAELRSAASAHARAYAITGAVNDCPRPATDIDGWPKDRLKECVYKDGPYKTPPYQLYVVLLDVPAATTARWIANSCRRQLPGVSGCFETVLGCAVGNSSMMFPVTGDVPEDMGDGWYHYMFRNGMTVGAGGRPVRDPSPITLDQQKALAAKTVDRIPSGLTRFWRSLPWHLHAFFPDADAPWVVVDKTDAGRWQKAAQREMLGALDRPRNRLLEAYVEAHLVTLARGNCPDDSAP